MFCEPRCIPELDVRSLAELHQIAFELRTRPQLSRHQQAARAIEIDISGVAEQQTLQCACRVRQLRDLLAAHFPSRARIDEQATIGMTRHGQSTVAVGGERVSMPTRHRETALGVEREL